MGRQECEWEIPEEAGWAAQAGGDGDGAGLGQSRRRERVELGCILRVHRLGFGWTQHMTGQV